jgi:hypothetical protein
VGSPQDEKREFFSALGRRFKSDDKTGSLLPASAKHLRLSSTARDLGDRRRYTFQVCTEVNSTNPFFRKEARCWETLTCGRSSNSWRWHTQSGCCKSRCRIRRRDGSEKALKVSTNFIFDEHSLYIIYSLIFFACLQPQRTSLCAAWMPASALPAETQNTVTSAEFTLTGVTYRSGTFLQLGQITSKRC